MMKSIRDNTMVIKQLICIACESLIKQGNIGTQSTCFDLGKCRLCYPMNWWKRTYAWACGRLAVMSRFRWRIVFESNVDQFACVCICPILRDARPTGSTLWKTPAGALTMLQVGERVIGLWCFMETMLCFRRTRGRR